METWRLILDPPSPAGYNMAVDEALVDSCRRSACSPTIRLYGWDRPAISLGYFQRPEAVVDLDRCRDSDIPVVKRTTGGRAVLHHHEVTYSVVAPIPHPCFPPSIRGSYDVISRVLEASLLSLGLPVTRNERDAERQRHHVGSPLCFDATSRHELTLNGRKVVGSAQRRWPSAFLQHGSMMMSAESPPAGPWLRHATGHSPLTGLRAYRGDLTRDHVYRALVESWQRLCDVHLIPGELTADETDRVAQSSHARDLAVTQAV